MPNQPPLIGRISDYLIQGKNGKIYAWKDDIRLVSLFVSIISYIIGSIAGITI